MSDTTLAADGGTYPGGAAEGTGSSPGATAPPTYQPQSGAGAATATQPFDPRAKSTRLAAFLSLVVPGLGLVYIGYYVRGFVTTGTILLLMLFAFEAPYSLGPLPGFLTFFVWLFAAIDAGRMAALYNHAVAGSGSFQIPQDFELPATGGSIVGGALLLALGAIALSNTVLGYSLDWIEDWWPLLPLAIGAYLLIRGVMDLQGNAPATPYDEDVSD